MYELVEEEPSVTHIGSVFKPGATVRVPCEELARVHGEAKRYKWLYEQLVAYHKAKDAVKAVPIESDWKQKLQAKVKGFFAMRKQVMASLGRDERGGGENG